MYLRAISIALYQLSGPIERAKYYAIWTLTEVCFIPSRFLLY